VTGEPSFIRRAPLAMAVTAAVAVLAAAGSVWAWGDVGHKVVCEIAFHELTDHARAEVVRLIKKDTEFKAFSDSCVWPDHPKQRETEHYINVPRDFRAFVADQCPGRSRCLFSAIRSDLEVLTTPGRSDQARLGSLKFLGHWIGDLHQPLHVSFADDRGGTRIVEGDGACAGDLHGVWDWCIIEQTMGRNARTIARHLGETITDADRTAAQSGHAQDWATESLAVARQASVLYCVQNGNACDYAAGRPTYRPGSRERMVKVDAAYLKAHRATVAEQLKRGGVRLAALLNRAFAQ
jgi:hypothetical protein